MSTRAILYDKPECPFCWRVRMALHRCGLVYDRRDHESREAEWKSLTSSGTVPVLRIGELVMTDSSVMLEYLNHRFGGLWPQSPEVAANARSTAIEADRGVGSAVRDLVFECRDRPPELWDRSTIDKAVTHWQQAMPALEHALGDGDFFVPEMGVTDYVLATRFGLAMAYGMPRADSAPLNAWYERICRRPEYMETAPQRVIAAIDKGWQA